MVTTTGCKIHYLDKAGIHNARHSRRIGRTVSSCPLSSLITPGTLQKPRSIKSTHAILSVYRGHLLPEPRTAMHGLFTRSLSHIGNYDACRAVSFLCAICLMQALNIWNRTDFTIFYIMCRADRKGLRDHVLFPVNFDRTILAQSLVACGVAAHF